jgi:ribosomal protein S27E
MVKIGLQIKCQLENVTDLKAEGEDFRWYLKLKCANCGEETPEFVYLALTENQPLKGGRGHASLVVKCKLCARENSIDIIRESITSYEADYSNKFKTIVTFDCRGVEPIDFSPRVGWTVAGVNEEGELSGSVFKDVSLTDGEWADYDEKSKLSVGIYEIENKFVSVK